MNKDRANEIAYILFSFLVKEGFINLGNFKSKMEFISQKTKISVTELNHFANQILVDHVNEMMEHGALASMSKK